MALRPTDTLTPMSTLMRKVIRFQLAALACLAGQPSAVVAADLNFERVVIDDNFPGAYQVEVADINGDKKLDIVVVGGGTCAWYENPSWKKRIITSPEQTPGIISSASADVDGDGKAEVAIAYDFAMNEPTRGKLLFAFQVGAAEVDRWTLRRYVPRVSSIHRLRWARIEADPAPRALVVAPIFGQDAKPPSFEGPACYFLLQPGRPFLVDKDNGVFQWDLEYATYHPGARDCETVLHAIDVADLDNDSIDELLTADNSGARAVYHSTKRGNWSFRQLVAGAPGQAPQKGCSEVHLGRFSDGRKFLATIEPWHGNMVVVYPEQNAGKLDFGERNVIDDTLDAGHALWVADVDRDGNDEVFAGHRGKDHRVSVYKQANGMWHHTVIDRDIAAQDLRGGDLDGDGTPDVVAVGGSTHNVVWYRPIRTR